MLTPEVIREVLLSAALFIFVWYIVGGKLLKPYLALLIERESRTVGDEHRAIHLREEAHQLSIKIDNALYEARQKGIKKRDEIIGAAKAKAQEIVTAAQDEAAAKLERARRELTTELERAQKDVDVQATALSDVVLKRILNEGSRYTVH